MLDGTDCTFIVPSTYFKPIPCPACTVSSLIEHWMERALESKSWEQIREHLNADACTIINVSKTFCATNLSLNDKRIKSVDSVVLQRERRFAEFNSRLIGLASLRWFHTPTHVVRNYKFCAQVSCTEFVCKFVCKFACKFATCELQIRAQPT